jgi:tail protein
MPFPSPALPVPVLQPGQMNFGGLTFAGVVMGTPYQFAQMQGLDMPAVRSGDVDVPRDQGQLPGLDVYGGRSITVNLVVIPDDVSLGHAMRAFIGAMGATGSTEYPLYLQLQDMSTVAVMARFRKWTWNYDVGYYAGRFASGAAMWYCTDPRVYSVPSWEIVSPMVLADEGVTFPVTFPLSFGSSTSEVLTVQNGGNMEMRPILTFTGPLTVPWATNTTIPGDPTVTLDSGTGPTILAGDVVTVDVQRHAVTYQPAEGPPFSVRSWVTPGSDFWNLPPGDNLIAFGSADSSATTGTVGISWAWAWQL